MPSLPLPHRPYIEAVLAELGELVIRNETDVLIDCDIEDDTTDALLPLRAYFALADDRVDANGTRIRTVLRWRHTEGWQYGHQHDAGMPDLLSPLLTALIPTPAAVANAARRIAGGQPTAHLPIPAEETSAFHGPLPDEIREAVDDDDLTPGMAAQLATYAYASRSL
jgi:hypothetical protein